MPKCLKTLRTHGQFRRDTAPPVIRLKLGAEVSGQFGTNFVVPTCLVAEVKRPAALESGQVVSAHRLNV